MQMHTLKLNVTAKNNTKICQFCDKQICDCSSYVYLSLCCWIICIVQIYLLIVVNVYIGNLFVRFKLFLKGALLLQRLYTYAKIKYYNLVEIYSHAHIFELLNVYF